MTEGNGRLPLDAPVVELRDVWFSYAESPAVASITLRVSVGDFSAIVGPNGSGKSTLVKLALGLLVPQEGDVRLFGEPLSRFRGWSRVGYVPQVVAGIRDRFPATVGEIVAQGTYRGLSPRAFWSRGRPPEVSHALASTGMAHLAGRRVGELSVGQQQRVLLARALARRPELLVLDEPAAGVDSTGQEQLYELLRRLNRQDGITILMVSHDIGAVMREAKMVACINRDLVFHGPPHDLTQQELAQLYGFPVEVLLHDALHGHR